jgi:hypothetical protein
MTRRKNGELETSDIEKVATGVAEEVQRLSYLYDLSCAHGFRRL